MICQGCQGTGIHILTVNWREEIIPCKACAGTGRFEQSNLEIRIRQLEENLMAVRKSQQELEDKLENYLADTSHC